MAGAPRRCASCQVPLKATARADAQYCSRACKARSRRWRSHYDEAVDIGIAFLTGQDDDHVVRCPVCRHRFALGHGHRRDAVYDRPACRQAAYRARRAQRVRGAVTEPASCDGSPDPQQRGDQSERPN
ncbi:hypothetical protein ABT224_19505 [Streptomyces sp. NPDC001584]|uniref:hypothetical protein n=1 Tax=Streptomyces sp. NPDC001584 TaxID=3154521 RepID=UPI0033218171